MREIIDPMCYKLQLLPKKGISSFFFSPEHGNEMKIHLLKQTINRSNINY